MELHSEFEVSLGFMGPCLKIISKLDVMAHTFNPSIHEAETGGSLNSRTT